MTKTYLTNRRLSLYFYHNHHPCILIVYTLFFLTKEQLSIKWIYGEEIQLIIYVRFGFAFLSETLHGC